MKRIYVIRHCEAQGQSSNAPLTERGQEQAKRLATFFILITSTELFRVLIYVLSNPSNY